MIEEINLKENTGLPSAQAKMPKPLTGRQQILDNAATAVLSDRNKAYGNPEDNFRNIAEIWNWWFTNKPRTANGMFTVQDVAYMMILMKMARLKTNPGHKDSIIDAAGYAACAGDFVPW